MPLENDGQTNESLWQRYRAEPSQSLRTKLIEHYEPLVKKIAASLFARRIDEGAEYDEYFQLGMVGLIESVDRYDADKGAAFNTYAAYRIRGAILNGIKKMSERHEQYAYRAQLQRERLNSIVDRQNSESKNSLFEEMAEYALGMAICYMLDGTGLVRNNSQTQATQVYHVQELAQLRDRLVETVDALPERERLIIEYHYFQHINFNRIAKIIGVTKGRVSQIHKRALQCLRKKLAEDHSLDGYY